MSRIRTTRGARIARRGVVKANVVYHVSIRFTTETGISYRDACDMLTLRVLEGIGVNESAVFFERLYRLEHPTWWSGDDRDHRPVEYPYPDGWQGEPYGMRGDI